VPKPRNKFRDRLQYLALRYVAMTLQSFPVRVNYWLANRAGDVMYLVDRKHRHRALANLRNSFPDAPEATLKQYARESMRQLLSLGVDVMWTTRLVKTDNFEHFVELGDFKKSLQLLLSDHKGMILLTGHYGNWEILGYVLATLGFPTVSVARPLDNPYINDYVLGVRERRGQKIIDKKGATTDVTQTLDAGGMVGFTADQDAGVKGIFVDFFGRKASAYKSIALLAMQYNIPVVIGYSRRIADEGFRFKIGTQDIIYPADWKDHDQPLQYITQRYTRAIEDFVRAEPGQYLWSHRRWKTRPKNEQAMKFD
jgi:Kdo2-lipid IVA lauroyltransferase/acyltransferase